jgi:hypothetical protein
MKLSTIALSAIVFGSLVAPAKAGQSVVTNSMSHEVAHGKGTLDTSYVKNESGKVLSFSKALKIDAVGPRATAAINVNNGHFSGSGFATNNPTNPDPWVAVGDNTTIDNSTYTAKTEQKGHFAYTSDSTTTNYSLFAGGQ